MRKELFMDTRTHQVVRLIRKLNDNIYEVSSLRNSNKRYIVEKTYLRPAEFYYKKSEKDVA